jgi:hypothetical protein
MVGLRLRLCLLHGRLLSANICISYFSCGGGGQGACPGYPPNHTRRKHVQMYGSAIMGLVLKGSVQRKLR